MAREFVPFDEAVIDKEFAALDTSSPADAAKLDMEKRERGARKG